MSGIPTWLSLIFIAVLVVLSGLFSGLNLGLMGLDPTGLEIVISGGQEPNKKYAQKIKPLRDHGNWLLCTLLLGNVAVNAAMSILLSEFTNGTVGFLLSTALIVIFGEIVPQALCSRYALWIGSKTIYLVWPLMWLLAVIAYPIAWILDIVLGDELPTIYSNKELQTLVDIHVNETGLNQRTANMLKGALGLQEKQVRDVMTVFTEVFWLHADAKLTFDVLVEIFKSGHSRIPIISIDKFDRTTVEGILYVKDLILLDPDDEMPVAQIMNAFRHKRPPTVWLDNSLDTALRVFLKSNQHLAIVQSISERGDHMSALNLKQPSVGSNALVAPMSIRENSVNSAMNRFGTNLGDNLGIDNRNNHSNPGSNSALMNSNNSRDNNTKDGSNNNNDPNNLGGDRIYEFIGIITLEDVIEHVLQTQLVDEHDNFVDTQHNQKTGRLDNFKWELLHMFDHRHRVLTNLPPQELQAVYHFLSQTVRSFAPGTARMSEASIKNLLASSSVIRVNLHTGNVMNIPGIGGMGGNNNNLGDMHNGGNLGVSGKLHSSSSLNGNNDGGQWDGHGGAARRLGYGPGPGSRMGPSISQRDPYKEIENNGLLLYMRDVRTNYFSLLLDGKCEVNAGKQGFRCELTRWSYLCPDALDHVEDCVLHNKPILDYVADFTCKVIENSRVLRIKLSDFKACLEGKFEPQSNDPFDIRQIHSQPNLLAGPNDGVSELRSFHPRMDVAQPSSANNDNTSGLMSNQRNPSSSSLSGHINSANQKLRSRNYAEQVTGRGLPGTAEMQSMINNNNGKDVITKSASDVEINIGASSAPSSNGDATVNTNNNSTNSTGSGNNRRHIYTNTKKESRRNLGPHGTIHEGSVERSNSGYFDDQASYYAAANETVSQNASPNQINSRSQSKNNDRIES